jgi:hypothetical protein
MILPLCLSFPLCSHILSLKGEEGAQELQFAPIEMRHWLISKKASLARQCSERARTRTRTRTSVSQTLLTLERLASCLLVSCIKNQLPSPSQDTGRTQDTGQQTAIGKHKEKQARSSSRTKRRNGCHRATTAQEPHARGCHFTVNLCHHNRGHQARARTQLFHHHHLALKGSTRCTGIQFCRIHQQNLS